MKKAALPLLLAATLFVAGAAVRPASADAQGPPDHWSVQCDIGFTVLDYNAYSGAEIAAKVAVCHAQNGKVVGIVPVWGP